MKLIVCTLMVFFLASKTYAQSAQRLEDLFIWKVSDELKLSVVEEESFSTSLRTLNQRRLKINGEIDQLLKELRKSAATESTTIQVRLLRTYENKLKMYSETQLEEIRHMERILGPQRAAIYFSLKNDLALKIRQSLTPPQRVGSPAKLAPPKIVIE